MGKMMANVSTLDVFLHGDLVGTMTHVGNDRSWFAFTEGYINDVRRPVLSLGFKDVSGGLITDFRPTQAKLLPFFSNLLPEGAMRDYLADRAGVNPEREFFLLWVLGQDLPGAITVKPADGEDLPPGVSETKQQAGEGDQPMRFSLAGVQLKFSAAERAAGGLTSPATGAGGSWIVKLPSSRFEGVPENEYAMMELARQLGMDVPETRLLRVDDVDNIPEGIRRFGDSVFAIKRFDRTEAGVPVHTEDFAQIFGVYPHDKYKKASMRNLAQVIGMEGSEEDIAEFVRRLVFNTLIGNADMHLKNWSILYKDKYSASLAPAYDFVSTIPYIHDQSAALKVSRSKKFADFTLDELSHLAGKAMLPEKLVLDTAKETVSRFHEVWQQAGRNLPLSKDTVAAINRHLEGLPIASL